MRLTVLLIALAALIAGCGYKTPLKLPPSKPAEKATAQKPAPGENDKKPASEP